MKRSLLTTAFALTFAGAASAGPVGLIDDFELPGLTDYTQYKVLDQGAATNTVFDDAAGVLGVTGVGADGAEQTLLLRGDYTLEVFEELIVDGPAAIGGANDLGLAIGQTPTGLVGAGDNRSLADFLFVSFRSPTQLNSRGFNGNSEVGQVQSFGVTADAVFIARTDTNEVELGWYDGATRNVMRTETVATTDIFNNVGFYTDVRGDGNTAGDLDNLRIGLVPEPASLALLGLGGLAMLRRRG